MGTRPVPDRLKRYRDKRAADRTPEPFEQGTPRPRLFVLQQHAARRMHWDLRLEWRGVLLSWAVPKGPSLDPSQKRLAVRVEDHPVEYADFEGEIPADNYGAGPVIVWDLGQWVPIEDPDAGLESGKLLFDLRGYKAKGRFTLVQTKGRGENEWLLIKKQDSFAREEPSWSDTSVLSGRRVEEIGREAAATTATLQALDALHAPRSPLRPLRPMLAERADQPFSDPDWIFEVKYDGYRAICSNPNGKALVQYRSGRNVTERFPELARCLHALPFPELCIDGELVVNGADGRPSFSALQARASLDGRREIAAASTRAPASLFVFDLLHFGPFDLRGLPFRERRRLLEGIVPPAGPLALSLALPREGERLFREATRLGFEGVVAKRADSVYRDGRRSPDWKKVRALRTDDFIIVGASPSKRGRLGFGALHLATPSPGGLHYVGRVGSGFAEGELRALSDALEPLARGTPPCPVAIADVGGQRWVEPELVCEVRYAEVTRDGSLRQPVFLRLRDDKTAQDCESILPRNEEISVEQAPEVPGKQEAVAASREKELRFTNLDKVFWPDAPYTKGDLIAYYRRIAPWLLPYLRDRPVVLTRYPDGIEGKSFFQKDAPPWTPAWVRTETLWSEHAKREIHYFVCNNLESLLYLANLGTIPLHVWSSRLPKLGRPDWCILDLDPKGAPFADVVEIARGIFAICRRADVTPFVKTSGASGLHILLPLGGQLSYEESRQLAGLVGRLVVRELPEIATMARTLRAREGKVYVDTLQNGRGRLLVGPFSVRPIPGAPVSMPLRWKEVTPRLDPARYHIRNAARRMAQLKTDPLLPVLDTRVDWVAALGRWSEEEARGAKGARPDRPTR